MRIHLATDHAGFALKEEIKVWLHTLGYLVSDEGAFVLEAEDDYPEFVQIVAKQVSANPEEDRGIIFGGSGQGEAITANRFRNVRAAVYYGGDEQIVRLSREHNNANILSIGARFVNLERAKEVIKLWLDTEFTGEERHIRRLPKIDTPVPGTNEF
ncbi:MAG: RpiB/LacA/LacB family sugar-phosphate isomerase [Patescibacteria group bacterium]